MTSHIGNSLRIRHCHGLARYNVQINKGNTFPKKAKTISAPVAIQK